MNTIIKMPIFDGHNDTLLKLSPFKREGGRSFFSKSGEGHLDLPRARVGGFGGGMFAICVPTSTTKPDSFEDALTVTDAGYEVRMSLTCEHTYAQQFTISASASLFRLEAESDGQLKVVRTADELITCLQQGVLAAVLHFEGAEAIDPALDALYVFYEAGLRSLGIVWSRPNVFAHGVPFRFPSSPDTGPGLTDAGRELVRACNQLGILLDLAHLNERGFWDVAQLSDAPLVSSHAGVHDICPSARNLTDKQLDAIGESGGVVGVNFHVGDLRTDGRFNADTPLTQTVHHIDYVAERIGIDHVAFGSDFDGALMSQELGDAAGLPKLVAALRAHGYDDEALQKVTHENWIRVLRSTWNGSM
ncbi:MAG: membrane dipeptidase [Chloroflexi bacterium]|nr:membrane dipeptidase [Chloroflexota bacterium]